MKSLLLVFALWSISLSVPASDVPPPTAGGEYAARNSNAHYEDVLLIVRQSHMISDIKKMWRLDSDSDPEARESLRDVLALDDAIFERHLSMALAPHMDAMLAKRLVDFLTSEPGRALQRDYLVWEQNPDAPPGAPEWNDEIVAFMQGEDAAELRELQVNKQVWRSFFASVYAEKRRSK